MLKLNKTMLFVVALVAVVGCKAPKHGDTGPAAPFFGARAVLPGSPHAVPLDAKLLDESGALALFAGETAEDVNSNKARDANPDRPYRNSLFLRRRKADGTDEWRVLLTTGSNWREATGMSEWSSRESCWLKNHFNMKDAKFASDRRHLWLVCNTYNDCWDVVCSYDVQKDEFRALIDGFSLEEQPDGTILVHGKKSYPHPDDGLGAIWRDVWINLNGEIVRKGEIAERGSDH